MAEITAGMVKELRELTGLGMMECKKALEEAGGDMKKAEELLRIKSGAKASKAAKPTPKADVKNLSQIEVAIQVLGKAGEPMSCKAMVEAMTTQGLWTSPGGARPDATLYSSILREINNNGRGAHFRKRESRSTLSPNG